MSFYDLSKEERITLVKQINKAILNGLQKKDSGQATIYFADGDTYIRKAAYQETGKIYSGYGGLQQRILSLLEHLFQDADFKIRQTTINAAGEIGMKNFEVVKHFFDKGLFDSHHAVRNAVIGSVKKMGNKNPKPVLKWARKYLHHPDKEIRREICHGIELRGRTHPQDILPLLKELQDDQTARVKNTLVHVLGQISYKKGCFETVIIDLNTWHNQSLTDKAIEEIIDVHYRYRDFSVLTQEQVIAYIGDRYNGSVKKV
jgi:hypothetical protein